MKHINVQIIVFNLFKKNYLASTTTVTDGTPVESSGYVHFKEAGGALKLHQNKASWRSARLTCYVEGAVLASPENDGILAAMESIILGNSRTAQEHFFTGIHDTFSKGIFVSLEGSSLEDDLPVTWAPGKLPDSSYADTCVTMGHNGWLYGSKCTDEHPFMCYKKDPTTAPTLTNPSCGPADSGYTLDTTAKSCYKFHKEFKFWRDAFATCYSEGGHLAVIDNDYEVAVLRNLFQANEVRHPNGQNVAVDVAHIGFVDWGRQGGLWMTIHGQTLQQTTYINWNTGEPNNETNQHCGGLFMNGYLDDVNCYNGDPSQVKQLLQRRPKPG